MTRALVLGGGGVTGVAWELGMLAGLAEAGLDLSTADIMVGTSAGSVVGAQLCSGTPLEELYQRQLRPAELEMVARMGRGVVLRYGLALLRSRGDLTSFGRRLGAFSLAQQRRGRLPSPEARFAVTRSRLPSTQWPDRDLRVTVVDAHSGEFRVITKADGVELLDAVTASCAVPGVFPPVPIGDRVYIDGGVRTGANAGVALGASQVVALTPMARSVGPIPSTSTELDKLGVPYIVVSPDPAARTAIGDNVLDPAARAGAARAGRAQAPGAVERIRAVWA